MFPGNRGVLRPRDRQVNNNYDTKHVHKTGWQRRYLSQYGMFVSVTNSMQLLLHSPPRAGSSLSSQPSPT